MNLKQFNRNVAHMMKDDKHFEHMMARDSQMREFILKRFGFNILDMPVCPKCERMAFWDEGGTATCPRCGTHTPNPITYRTFLGEGYNVDRTVHPGAPRLVGDEMTTAPTATVYGGEAGLPDKDKAHVIVEPDKKPL